jgi:hypothetical protein
MDQRFDQVNPRFERVDQQFARHETRLMSLENWMRATFVTLVLVAVTVAAQLFYTLLRFGLKPPSSCSYDFSRSRCSSVSGWTYLIGFTSSGHLV